VDLSGEQLGRESGLEELLAACEELAAGRSKGKGGVSDWEV